MHTAVLDFRVYYYAAIIYHDPVKASSISFRPSRHPITFHHAISHISILLFYFVGSVALLQHPQDAASFWRNFADRTVGFPLHAVLRELSLS